MFKTLIRSLSIKAKIWSGFLLLLVVLAIMSIMTSVSLNGVQSRVVEVVEQRQPAVFLSKELAVQLEQSAGSLGFYLLSKEQEHQAAYKKSLRRVDEIIAELKAIIMETLEILSDKEEPLRNDVIRERANEQGRA